MDNTTKILIIVVVILVGVLGLAGGFILQGYFIKNNNSTNQSNASLNNTNNTTQSNSEPNNKSEYLSAGEAIDIAKSQVSIPINVEYTISTVLNPSLGPGDPAHWSILFINVKTGNSIVAVSIDASTGAIRKISYY